MWEINPFLSGVCRSTSSSMFAKTEQIFWQERNCKYYDGVLIQNKSIHTYLIQYILYQE